MLHLPAYYLYSLIYHNYKEKFVGLCKEIFQFGLKEHNKREEECQQFFTALSDAINENRGTGIEAIEAFEGFKKAVKTMF